MDKVTKTVIKRKFAGHVFRGSSGNRLLTVTEGFTIKSKTRGRPRKHWFENFREWTKRSYVELRRLVQDREK